MLADKIDNLYVSAARIVQIREAVRETRAEMQKGTGRLFCHARIPISGAGDNTFEKTKHATYSRHPVQLGDQVNFRGAWIRETCFDPSSGQRAKKAFCSVHRREGFILLPYAVENTSPTQKNLENFTSHSSTGSAFKPLKPKFAVHSAGCGRRMLGKR